MSLEDFLSHGEARVLWSRFESLVGQQVFRLRVEGETANVPSSLCSLLSCDLSSPERMGQLESSCLQPGHLQRNTNALEIDKQPLYGLPYIAKSTCPLLSLILLNIQELRNLDRFMDPCEALRRIREIKRSLIDVHKKALLLESQLHQYINPTLVTTLNRRSAKATFEAELMCKLIDKLRKDSRQSATEPEKRKRVCELTMKLKALLCRQKCEWQCVGRLKETLAIARDMKGVLRFICQLSCLLEHCSDSSRRLTERPPPYEYCSPYDSASKQESSDALYEDLKMRDNQCPPYQSRSSQSQVTISLSLDFTSDREFEGRSHSSDDSSRTRTSSYRRRSHSHSRSKDYSEVKTDSDTGTLDSRRRPRDYSDINSDSDATALSSRRHGKHSDVKTDSDGGTLSSRRRRKSRPDCPCKGAKSSKNHLRRAKSASSFSGKSSSRGSRKHICDSEGKSSASSRSRQQTVPSSMEASEVMHDMPVYSRTSKSLSPVKSTSLRERLRSKQLAEETINELIEVLEDYIGHKSESLQRSEGISSPPQSLYKSGDASPSEPTSKHTFQVYSDIISETPLSKLGSRSPSKPPSRLSKTSFSPTVQEHSLRSGTHNDLLGSHTLSRQSFLKDLSSGHSQGWSSASPRKSLMKSSLKDSRQSLQSFEAVRSTRQDSDNTRLSRIDQEGSQPDLSEVKTSEDGFQESRVSRQNATSVRTSSPDFKSGTMSKQTDVASMSKDILGVPQDDIQFGRNSYPETTLSKQNLSDARTSSFDFKSSTLSKQQESAGMSKTLSNISQDLGKTRISQGELNSGRLSIQQDETRLSRQNDGESRMSWEQPVQTRNGQYDSLKTNENQQNFADSKQIRISQRELKSSKSNRQSSEEKRKRMDDLGGTVIKRKSDPCKSMVSPAADTKHCKRICDQLRSSTKGLKKNELDEMSSKKRSPDERSIDRMRRSGKDSDDVVDINRAQIERQRQLARECADVVRRRIASISSPPPGYKQTQSGKQICASTSPPRVRREVDKICSRFEKNSVANSESTGTKNSSELSAHSLKKQSKIMSSPLSVISESHGYQSPNTEVQELEEDAETNNVEDISTNRNKSDSTSTSPRDIQISKSGDRCRHRRTTTTLMSKMSEDCKFYMQPRSNTSNSSGSRDPLLLSSQETSFSYGCGEESDLSCRFADDFKRRSKPQRHKRKRTKARRCLSDVESDLLEDTTTTTDSCLCDDESTSVSSHKSFSGRQQSSRTHHMDDTEGDIDQESDFEEELQQKYSREQITDKESGRASGKKWGRKSSGYPKKSESRQSRRSASQSSQRSGSIIAPPLRKMSASPRPGSGRSGKATPSRASDKCSEDQTQPLRQLLNDQISASEELMPEDGSHRSRYDEMDLRASDLAYIKSAGLSEHREGAASLTRSLAGSKRSTTKSDSLQSLGPEEESPFAQDQSQTPVHSSIKRFESLVQSEHQASLGRSASGQRSLPGASQSKKASTMFSQRLSPCASQSSSVQGSPHASSVRFSSSGAPQHSRLPMTAVSAQSGQGYPSEISGQQLGYQGPGMSEYAASRVSFPTQQYLAGSAPGSPQMLPLTAEPGASQGGFPVGMYPPGSGHGYHPSVLEHPQRQFSPTGIPDICAKYLGLPAPVYPAGSMPGHPSVVPPPPGLASQRSSYAGSFPATYPAGSVPGSVLGPAGSVPGSMPVISQQLQMFTAGTPSGPPGYSAVSVHQDLSTMLGQPQMQQFPTAAQAPGSLRAESFDASYAAGSVHTIGATSLVQKQILHLTPSISQQPYTATQSSLSHPEAVATLQQPYGLHSTPTVSQQNSLRAQSPAPFLRSAEGLGQQMVQQTQSISQQPSMREQASYAGSTGVGEQPERLQLTPRSSQQPILREQAGGSYAGSTRAGEQPEMLQLTPRSSQQSSLREQAGGSYAGSTRAGEQPETLQLTPRSSQQPSQREQTGGSYAGSTRAGEKPETLQLTPRSSQQPFQREQTGGSYAGSTRSGEQPETLQLTPRLSQQPSQREQTGGSYAGSSRAGEQPETLQLTPRLSQQPSLREQLAASYGELSGVGQQSQIQQLTPRLSQQPLISAQSSLRAYSVPSAISEQPENDPVESLRSSMRAPSSLRPESSLILEQQQIVHLSPEGSQPSSLRALSSLRAPSSLSHPAGSIQADSVLQQQEEASDSQVATTIHTQEFPPSQLGLQAASSEARQPEQSSMSESSRHMSAPSSMPEVVSASSRHLPAQSDLSYPSGHSPSKSLRTSLTHRSESADINTDDMPEDRTRTPFQGSSVRSSRNRVHISPKVSEQNDFDFEEPDSVMASISSSGRDQNELVSREKWWLYVPLVILILMVLYYIICYATNSGGCAGCRAPLPNIFFYLINSAVHSVRLIHSTPAPV